MYSVLFFDGIVEGRTSRSYETKNHQARLKRAYSSLLSGELDVCTMRMYRSRVDSTHTGSSSGLAASTVIAWRGLGAEVETA